MNKNSLIQVIITKLTAELALNLAAAKTAAAGATDEQSKSEGKYDTRGLELSYLAAGQGRQIAEAEAVIEQFRTLTPRKFAQAAPIDLTAVITLEPCDALADAQPLYFLAPRGGGTEVEFAGKEIVVITPQSPLGQQLLGKKQGDRFKFSGRHEYRIGRVV